jgi:hypothetical protein
VFDRQFPPFLVRQQQQSLADILLKGMWQCFGVSLETRATRERSKHVAVSSSSWYGDEAAIKKRRKKNTSDVRTLDTRVKTRLMTDGHQSVRRRAF